MNGYEQIVKKSLWQTIFFLAIAIIALIFIAICAISLNGHSLKLSLLLSGAVMAAAALIAQNRYDRFKALLTPNTFAGPEFNSVLIKYRNYKSIGSWMFLLIALIGIIVSVYSSFVD